MLLSFDVGIFSPILFVVMGVLMVVLRAGASRVYFDVVGTFQANRMLKDAQAMSTTMNALMLDAFSGVEEAAQILGDPITQMIDNLVPLAKTVGEAHIEFEKFVQEGEDLEAVTSAVIRIGEGFGFTADEALKAAARMAQLGGVLGPGMVGPGTEVGMIFGLISGMETEAAMQRMINLQQQTKFMTEALEENLTMEERAMKIRANSMHVLDQLNTIENRSAATMAQITYVMNQFAAQAHLTGESIAFMAAMSATLIEAGEEQGKGGRALKMIYARLGANTSGAADALHELGVATKDAEDNLRPLSDIIRDLVAEMDDKTASEKQNIAQLVAGNRHYVRLIKLMENFNRVEQLALEATLALSPAQEEVNRRLDKNITSLRIAEAELHNYQATIGELLIPGLIHATRRQTDFTVAMGELLSGKWGDRINTIVKYIKTLGGIAAPMIQATISLNQLNVATQTYKVLTRAIAGDDIVRSGFMERFKDDIGELTMSHKELNAVLKAYRFELNAITTQQKVQEIESVSLTEKEIESMKEKLDANNLLSASNQELLLQQTSKAAAMNQEIALQEVLTEKEKEQLLRDSIRLQLGKTYNRQQDEESQITIRLNNLGYETHTLSEMLIKVRQGELGEITKSITAIKASNFTRKEENRLMQEVLAMHFGQERAKEMIIEMEKIAEAEVERKKSMKTMQARTRLISQFSMATMGASMALSIWGKGEKSAKAAMVLTTMGMIPYILNMMQSTAATVADGAAKTFTTSITAALGVTNLFTAATYRALAASALIAVKSLGRFVAAIALVGAIAYVLVEVAEWLGIFNTEFKEMDNAISTSVLLDAEEIIRVFGLSMFDAAEEVRIASEEVRILSDEIASLEDRGVVVPSDLTSELQKWTAIEESRKRGLELLKEEDIIAEMGIDRMKELISFEEDRIQYLKEHEHWTTPTYMNEIDLTYGGVGEEPFLTVDETAGANERFLEFLEKYSHVLGENADEWKKMEAAGLTTVAEIDGAIHKLEGLANRSITEGVIGGITDELQDAKDALYEFANAREELFFGFAAANVTGDLVKQVVNKGVETLITNTEVIMTNNFNGMTTREVADEILLQIERRAGSLQGITITG